MNKGACALGTDLSIHSRWVENCIFGVTCRKGRALDLGGYAVCVCM